MRRLIALLFLFSLGTASSQGSISGVTSLIDAADTSNLSSYTTGSFTPTANSLVVICIAAVRSSSINPSISTCSTSQSDTTVQIIDFGYLTSGTSRGKQYIYGYRASASPGATTVTTTWATALQGIRWQIFEVIGSDVANGVLQSFVQTPTTTANSTGTSFSITLSSAADSANRPFLFASHTANEVTNPRTNWTEIGDSGHSSPLAAAESQWRSDTFETTASASWSTSTNYGGVAFEIKAAVAGGGPTIFRNRRGVRAGRP